MPYLVLTADVVQSELIFHVYKDMLLAQYDDCTSVYLLNLHSPDLLSSFLQLPYIRGEFPDRERLISTALTVLWTKSRFMAVNTTTAQQSAPGLVRQEAEVKYLETKYSIIRNLTEEILRTNALNPILVEYFNKPLQYLKSTVYTYVKID